MLSFTNYDLINPAEFVGLNNYIKLLTKDTAFLKSIVATLQYTILTVPMQLTFALFIAFILNFKIKGINFFRSAYYIPSILGGNAAIAILWRFIFRSDGLVNQVLNVFGIDNVAWFSSPVAAMFVISLLKVWQFGSSMLIFLAALQEIPQELYEASEVDGATKLRTFFSVTIPLLTPTIFFNLIMQLVNAFQEFNGPYLITQGGPLKSTYLSSMFIYDNAFKFYKMGYSSAASWILFMVILTFTLTLFKSSSKWVYYSDGKGN
ncbi:MAG: ABC-type transporter, integral rane subunit [Clostridia bacterium]|jgi:oligogalacturonide transport system permease protein|nr:ABC-type transporter, integral rane subunit [Clostridia bacterium]